MRLEERTNLTFLDRIVRGSDNDVVVGTYIFVLGRIVQFVRVLFGKMIHKVHVAIRASNKSRPVFCLALRAKHFAWIEESGKKTQNRLFLVAEGSRFNMSASY
jgi:hypothetical protein